MRPQEQPTAAEEKPEKTKKGRVSRKGAKEFLILKILDNLDYFSEDEQKVLKKWHGLTSNEQSIKSRAIDRFWEEKYKKKFTGGAKDRKILSEYDPAEKELKRKAKKERKLEKKGEEAAIPSPIKIQIKSPAAPQKKEIAKSGQIYLEKYEEQTEGIEALSNLTSFFEEERLLKFEKNPDERKKLFQNLTEYQFLLTHFIITNNKNKEMLSFFWEAAKRNAGKEYQWRFEKLKRSVLTQSAIFHACEKLGIRPKLSHPSEDAFSAIDMWVMGDSVIQVKGDMHLSEPFIVSVDEIDFPGLKISSADKRNYYNNGYSRFRRKLAAYRKTKEKNINAFFVILPHKGFDPITGEPDDKVVDFFREELKDIIAEERAKILKRFVE